MSHRRWRVTTTYKDIRDAVKNRIVAGWTTTAIHWTATKLNPTIASPWIQPRLLFGSARAVSLGPLGHNRIAGDLHCNIFLPVGSGDDEAMTYADSFRALFPRGLLLPTANKSVTFETPEVIQALEDEDWFQVPVICPFYSDEQP